MFSLILVMSQHPVVAGNAASTPGRSGGAHTGGWLTAVVQNNFFVSSGAYWDSGAGGRVHRLADGLALIAGSENPGYRIFTRSSFAVAVVCPVTAIMWMDYDGNVGFGGVEPSYPLHMASGAFVSARVVWTNAFSREYKDQIEELTLAGCPDNREEPRSGHFHLHG
jgi:hypothetical protein